MVFVGARDACEGMIVVERKGHVELACRCDQLRYCVVSPS